MKSQLEIGNEDDSADGQSESDLKENGARKWGSEKVEGPVPCFCFG